MANVGAKHRSLAPTWPAIRGGGWPIARHGPRRAAVTPAVWDLGERRPGSGLCRRPTHEGSSEAA